jgi:outer membrane protein TolC
MTKRIKKIRNNAMLLLLLLLYAVAPAWAAGKTLTKNEFLSIVRSYHPFVKQADIRIARSQAEVLGAHGAFDPVLAAGVQRKILNDKLYYSYFNPEVTIPTWYGIDLKASLDDANGDFLNPETTPGKVGYAGVKINLNTIVYDRRRAALQQARLALGMSEYERIQTVNNLMYDALAAYWEWVRDYEVYRVTTAQADASRERIKLVRTEVEQGARAAIDTSEAIAQYQALMQQQQNAELMWLNSGYDLSGYLWLDDGSPARLPADVRPDAIALEMANDAAPMFDSLLSQVSFHPKLKMLDAKIDILELDQKLKKQYLLPKLAVSGGVLTKNADFSKLTSTSIPENHKAGIDFNMPLFLRDARANLKQANLKIRETELEKSYTGLQIENKLRASYAEFTSLRGQISSYETAVRSYRALYNGEMSKFATGESTIFMINTRELKLLEATQKLIELRAKLQKSYAGIYYAAGLLR